MKQSATTAMAGAVALAMAGCATNKPLREARVAYDAGQYMEASSKAREALRIDDRSAEALYIRGMAAVELKEYLMGRELLEKVRDHYKPNSEKGLRLRRQLALAHLFLEEVDRAEVVFNEYMAIKADNGRLLQEDDYYWAGAIADVALKDGQRDRYWSKLSGEFKKSKGIE